MLIAYTSNPDSTKKYLEPNPQRRLSVVDHPVRSRKI